MIKSKGQNIIRGFYTLLGSTQFAVCIISIFVVFMIVGTFTESWHGTEYANRLIYKSWPFFIVQGGMFFSVLVATLQRLPFQKRLHGFYVLHLGILLIFIGSFLTYSKGVDGQSILEQDKTTHEVILSEDVLYIQNEKTGRTRELPLPQSVFETSLNKNVEGIAFLRFLPYSNSNVVWENISSSGSGHSAEYTVTNRFVSQKTILSLDPEAGDFPSAQNLGPLYLQYLPENLYACFGQKTKTIFWNLETKDCKTLEEIRGRKTRSTDPYYEVPYNKEVLYFYPGISAYPLSKDLQVRRDLPLRLLDLQQYEGKKILFLFGDKLSYHAQGWIKKEFEGTSPLSLPWMGLGIQLSHFDRKTRPAMVPFYTTPKQENNQIVSGTQKAVLVRTDTGEQWIHSEKPARIVANHENFQVGFGKRKLELPFSLALTQFKMDTNPGTQEAASYESFITLFKRGVEEKFHIYMNNPLKYGKYTFYQSSYFNSDDGRYGSVLSVNFDPGRPLKYSGSFLLVSGSFWHFVFSRRKFLFQKKWQHKFQKFIPIQDHINRAQGEHTL